MNGEDPMEDENSMDAPPDAMANTNGTGGSQQGANPAPTGNLNAYHALMRTISRTYSWLSVKACMRWHGSLCLTRSLVWLHSRSSTYVKVTIRHLMTWPGVPVRHFLTGVTSERNFMLNITYLVTFVENFETILNILFNNPRKLLTNAKRFGNLVNHLYTNHIYLKIPKESQWLSNIVFPDRHI